MFVNIALQLATNSRPTASVSGGQGIWQEKPKAQNPPLGLNPLGRGATPPTVCVHAMLDGF